MFQNIRNVLETYEKTYNNIIQNGTLKISEEDENIIQYFGMHLAKALMQDEFIPDVSIAKIILATRDLSNDITVKIQ
jgi:hypothetical protein